MKIQFRSLLYFIVLLMFCFSMIIFANDWKLVDTVTIPAWEDVLSKSEYTNPTKDFANQMTQWANICTDQARYLRTQMDGLEDKRATAKTAAYGGINWRSKIRRIATDAASKSYYGMLNSFVDDLENTAGKIDREQLYAAACKEVNTRYPTLKSAMQMMDDMYKVALQVRGNYERRYSGSGLYAITPKPHITLPDIETPEWGCYGNNSLVKVVYGTVTCQEKWDTPYKALNIHRIWCGGEKDPASSVAGCNLPYYTCQPSQVQTHEVLYCHRPIMWHPPGSWNGTEIGICGEPFRKCPGSLSRAGVHDYRPVSG